MKCMNCGAEIDEGSKKCNYCGSQITEEMIKEQEKISKRGCPNCKSKNITFKRESVADKKGRKVTTTVGLCNDCGYTFYPEGNAQPKKNLLWLWILGWICIFPIPLTILMLRSSNKLEKKIRYGIIAIAWIVYLCIVVFGKGGSDSTDAVNNESEKVTNIENNTKTKSDSKDEETTQEQESKVENNTEETSNDSASNGEVTPELKEFLDSYEAFVNEYCDFLDTYDENDATMLVKYTELVAKEKEFSDKADKYDEDEMSEADRNYYIEVMTRIEAKLLITASKN